MIRGSGETRRAARPMTAVVIVLGVWGLAAPAMIFQPLLFDDDASYVAHAMTIGIDLDLDYSNEIANRVRERPSGAVTPTHPIGPGLLASPLVAAFSLVDRALGHPVIDDRSQFPGSWSILGFFVASAFALVVGAWLYLRAFARLDVRLSRPFVLLLLGGTGVAFYGLNRFTMGHSFEFAMAALVFWASVELVSQSERRLRLFALLAAGALLSVLIRPANVNIVLLPAIIWAVLHLTNVGTTALIRAGEARRFTLFALPAAGILLLLNQVLYGVALPNRSQMYGMRSRSFGEQFMEVLRAVPTLRHVLFSSEYGIGLFMAVVPVGVALLLIVLATRVRPGTSWSARFLSVGLVAAYAAVPVAVVLIWQSHARSYGYRYLFSLIPLGMLGVAIWWQRPATRLHRATKWALGGLSAFGLAGQVFFQTTPALRPGPGVNAFGRDYSHAAVGYSNAVLEALVNPTVWLQAGVMRFPGFVGALLLGPERTEQLAASFGFVPVTRVSTGVPIGPLAALEWFASAAPGTLVATVLFVGVALPAAFLGLGLGWKICHWSGNRANA